MEKLAMPGSGTVTIRPKAIDAGKHFLNTFGHFETEISARWIVKLCQEQDYWVSFRIEDIEGFYNRHGLKNFCFNNLVKDGFLLCDDGLYQVTIDFVVRCYIASPAV